MQSTDPFHFSYFSEKSIFSHYIIGAFIKKQVFQTRTTMYPKNSSKIKFV